MNGLMSDGVPIGVCTRDPERWTTLPDAEAKAACRACPRRWLCAREACESPRAEGLWAGIFVPESGRGRTVPTTATQYSYFSSSAAALSGSGEFSSTTIWVMP